MNLDLLLAAASGVPALPGALCRGRPHLFDGSDGPDGARTRQAAGLCGRCTSLLTCRSWADQQPPKHLDGVIGGRLYVWAGTPGGCRIIELEAS
ncbi:hypothetical protein ACNQR7_26945 [Mycolicibacterium senegalense]|uniref:hypothetical protein n=1 Tax=Mycolicibacterium TaxID=1866885 RepID=UPI003204A955